MESPCAHQSGCATAVGLCNCGDPAEGGSKGSPALEDGDGLQGEPILRCPRCGHAEDRVVETRDIAGGAAVRRRRECLVCQRRFTTYETVAPVRIGVVKRSGRVERFDRKKILGGLRKACANRPVDLEVIEEIVRYVEDQVWSRAESGEETIPSQVIGELVLSKLAEVDRIAYLRFASVYRRFDDPRDFEKEIARLLEAKDLVSDSSNSAGF